jgi:hypothetical protein
VGDERWKEVTLPYVGKGLRSTEIEFFPPSALKKAKEWVKCEQRQAFLSLTCTYPAGYIIRV